MKKQNLLDNLLSAFRTAVQYWNDHAASHQAFEEVYVRKWRGEDPAADYSEQILINAEGSIYKVTHRYFVNGDLLREDSYLATYSWHCNGHLIALGRERLLVADPLQRRIYMEDFPTDGVPGLETFEQL